MVEECSHGLMEALTQDSSWRITLKAVESTNGQTEGSMMVSGRITRWRVTVSLHGLTVEGTKEST